MLRLFALGLAVCTFGFADANAQNATLFTITYHEQL